MYNPSANCKKTVPTFNILAVYDQSIVFWVHLTLPATTICTGIYKLAKCQNFCKGRARAKVPQQELRYFCFGFQELYYACKYANIMIKKCYRHRFINPTRQFIVHFFTLSNISFSYIFSLRYCL